MYMHEHFFVSDNCYHLYLVATVRFIFFNFFIVGDKNMLSFIRDKTADPYFWNLVWFIGNHAIELDNCVLKESQ